MNSVDPELPLISIVVPLYNEEVTLPPLVERLNQLMDSLKLKIEIVLVNDGSQDRTEEIIFALALNDSRYQVISLSRNFGHQVAISSGLENARGTEGVMIIDGDLQDPPELLEDFYSYLKKGYDVVYGVRKKRKEGFVKRFAYSAFYRMLRAISTIDLPIDSGDFSLISRRVVDLLNKMPEENRFIRGMRAWVGFKQIGIEYERQERFAGSSKYSFNALFKLAYNGIFNFSEFPIKLITWSGLLAFTVSIVYLVYVLVMKYAFHSVPQGFTATIFVISMFSSVQLLAMGIIGEYVTRLFLQSRHRPLFIVKTRIVNQELKQ